MSEILARLPTGRTDSRAQRNALSRSTVSILTVPVLSGGADRRAASRRIRHAHRRHPADLKAPPGRGGTTHQGRLEDPPRRRQLPVAPAHHCDGRVRRGGGVVLVRRELLPGTGDVDLRKGRIRKGPCRRRGPLSCCCARRGWCSQPASRCIWGIEGRPDTGSR
jgi:hypothetical protein